MINLIISLIIFILIIRYQSQIYHYLVSFPKIYLWLYFSENIDYFKKKQKELLDFGNMESYFDSLPNNQIHKYFMPLYDNSLLVKSDVPNIFHKDITSKENSLPYVIDRKSVV